MPLSNVVRAFHRRISYQLFMPASHACSKEAAAGMQAYQAKYGTLWQKPAIEYTSAQMLMQESTTRPNKALGRQGGSKFKQRRHFIYLTTAGDSIV
jgi:hypothetical protein